MLQESMARWGRDKGHLMAAALAYYMIFALAPLLVIVIDIAGAIFGEAAVQGQLFASLEEIVGAETAAFVALLVENASTAAAGRIVAVVGGGLLLYGASNVFYQLKMALNLIWRISPEPKNGFIHYIKTRSLALFMVLTLGFLFVLAFALMFALTTLGDYLVVWLPAVGRLAAFYQFFVILPLMVVLVALLFKILPDAHLAWRDVWLGAAVTAVLLLVGIQVLSFAITRFFTGSVYGAAGSLVVLLYFVYYSAQMLFFGAEFTYVYANKYGSQVRPFAHATVLIREARQGPEEPVYAMPVYTTPPAASHTAVPETPTRRLELRAALGLVGAAVVLFIAFLLGRKTS
ncbi:MAG: YihY/virulence factor BrkB family protein [Ardenticatenaceae bacterium]|nr:YihY/virulence factor BrkB family protein [Ardenticatenaceae bacterium]